VFKKKAKSIREAAKAREKEELEKIDAILKEAAKTKTEAKKQADVYQKKRDGKP
jgi:hypothetical protein